MNGARSAAKRNQLAFLASCERSLCLSLSHTRVLVLFCHSWFVAMGRIAAATGLPFVDTAFEDLVEAETAALKQKVQTKGLFCDLSLVAS